MPVPVSDGNDPTEAEKGAAERKKKEKLRLVSNLVSFVLLQESPRVIFIVFFLFL